MSGRQRCYPDIEDTISINSSHHDKIRLISAISSSLSSAIRGRKRLSKPADTDILWDGPLEGVFVLSDTRLTHFQQDLSEQLLHMPGYQHRSRSSSWLESSLISFRHRTRWKGLRLNQIATRVFHWSRPSPREIEVEEGTR